MIQGDNARGVEEEEGETQCVGMQGVKVVSYGKVMELVSGWSHWVELV